MLSDILRGGYATNIIMDIYGAIQVFQKNIILLPFSVFFCFFWFFRKSSYTKESILKIEYMDYILVFLWLFFTLLLLFFLVRAMYRD